MKSVRRVKSVAILFACGVACSVILAGPLVSRAVIDADTSAGSGASAASGGTGSSAAMPDGAVSNGAVDGAQATQPAQVPQRSFEEIYAEYRAANQQLSNVLPKNALTDAAARTKAAPKAIPIIYHIDALLDELQGTHKVQPTQVTQMKDTNLSTLYMLNDQPTVTKVKEMISSKNSARHLDGSAIELFAKWNSVGNDKAAATSVVDEVDKLDHDNPGSSRLTLLTLSMSQSTSDAGFHDRLVSLVTDVMTGPLARQIKTQIDSQKKAEAQQAAMLNKKFVVEGKTVEGKAFTTADWKGNVVLVDFWATWCGPCRAGLPHVKEVYNKFHGKGLELVGVSNDYDASALTDFTPKNDMPWPQLFDPNAASERQWNPITLNNGIHGIPTMFLIDKKGVLRSITAREDMDDLIPKLLAE